MSWCFALVNNRLAEICFEYYRGKPRIIGHFYAKGSEYTSKQEKRWIKEDIAHFQLIYRKSTYKRKDTHEVIKNAKPFDHKTTRVFNL